MSRAKKARPVVIAATSDQHAGGTTALCPDKIQLDDGGEYHPSKLQRWIWHGWEGYWGRVAAVRAEHDADLYTVFHGDLVEGDHHNTSQLASRNPNAQAAILTECVSVPLRLNPDRIFVVRGTEAHVGHSASAEERIADGLRRDKRPIVGDPDTGAASWWHLRMEVHGLRIDVTHHGRTGQREHTRAGAAALHAHDILLSHVKRGDPYPHLCIRGHYHRFNDSHDACPVRVITTGCWQMGTAHVHKVAADTLADIGGLIVVIQPDGSYTAEKVQFKPDQGAVWRPS